MDVTAGDKTNLETLNSLLVGGIQDQLDDCSEQ